MVLIFFVVSSYSYPIDLFVRIFLDEPTLGFGMLGWELFRFLCDVFRFFWELLRSCWEVLRLLSEPYRCSLLWFSIRALRSSEGVAD